MAGKVADTVRDAADTLPSAETAREQAKHLKSYNFDVLKAYRLRVLNRLSYQDIADHLGEPKSSVYKALAQLVALTHDHERMQQYEEIRPALLSVAEERLVASLVDEETIAKATLNNRAYAFTQLHNARRLESGQSTANLSVLGKIVTEVQPEGRARDLFKRTAAFIVLSRGKHPAHETTLSWSIWRRDQCQHPLARAQAAPELLEVI
jgi:hypothetical protein